jgi:phosphatidate cytidylyltransferase
VQQRSISAIGVVVVGLVPAVLGGWLFAIVYTAICVIACQEAIRITHPPTERVGRLALIIVILAGLLPMFSGVSNRAGLLAAVAIGVPLSAAVFFSNTDGIATWTTTSASSLYLGLPALAAISLRKSESFPAHDWVGEIAGVMPDVSSRTGGGLAWFLLALLVTWLSDTCAYLVGKTWGRHKLIPRVSPNKTIEGAAGGLAAAAVVAIICDWAFGMGVGPGWAGAVGLVLGAIGMLGDLSESMLKRQRGIKDSGNLIPGHGGMLDRIDALIFVTVSTWLIAPAFT